MSAIALDAPAPQRGFLLRTLLVDGLLCTAFGLLLVVAAGPLGDLFDLPVLLLRLVGVGLLPWAGFVLYAGTRPATSRRAAWTVAAANCGWVVASLGLLLSGQVEPSGIGDAFVLAQALLVALLAGVQFTALRRAGDMS